MVCLSMFNQCFLSYWRPVKGILEDQGKSKQCAVPPTASLYPLPVRHSVLEKRLWEKWNNVGSWKGTRCLREWRETCFLLGALITFWILYHITCLTHSKDKVKHSCSHLLTMVFGVSVGLWRQTPVWFLTLSSCVNLSKFLSSSKPLFPYCDTNIMITMLDIKLEIEKAVPGSGNWLWQKQCHGTPGSDKPTLWPRWSRKQTRSLHNHVQIQTKEQHGPNHKNDKMSPKQAILCDCSLFNKYIYLASICAFHIMDENYHVILWSNYPTLLKDSSPGLSLPFWDPLLNLLTGAQILLHLLSTTLFRRCLLLQWGATSLLPWGYELNFVQLQVCFWHFCCCKASIDFHHHHHH